MPLVIRVKASSLFWLHFNGEAIYGTETLKENYKEGEFIRYTKKKSKNIYYGILLKKPQKEAIFKMIKPKPNSNIILLGNPKSLKWNYSEEKGLVIETPEDVMMPFDNWKAWTFKIERDEI